MGAATSATNAMGPARAVATATSATPSTIATSRARVASSPSERALSSERAMSGIRGEKNAVSTRRTTSAPPAVASSGQPTDPMPPTIQTSASDASRTSARVMSQPSRPDTIEARPMPTSTKRMPVRPSRHARPHISAATTSAPANAATDTAGPSSPRSSIDPTAARLAPPVTPRMSGLASGLRSVVWKSAPPRPRAVPAMIAARTRGSRSRRITNSAFGRALADQGRDHVTQAEPGGAEEQRRGGCGERDERDRDHDARDPSASPHARRTDPPRDGVDRPAGGRGGGDGCGAHSDAPLPLRTSAMSTGAPTIAATMPASSSAGATTTRPITSAASSTIAPSTPASGVSQR